MVAASWKGRVNGRERKKKWYLMSTMARLSVINTICRGLSSFPGKVSRGQGSSQCPPLSDQLFNSTPQSGSFRLGDSTFYSLIRHYAHTADFASLDNVLCRMKLQNRVFIEKCFLVIFKAYGRAHLPDKAVDLFHRMSHDFHCIPTVKSFNSVLNVIIREGFYHRALDFYNRSVNAKNTNISPNVLTFNLLLKALCKLGWVDRAVEVFREMPLRKCPPDVYTYCTLMDGLCKEDRIDEAVSLLDEMQTEGCFPSPVIFNVLINGLCKKGDLVRAAKLVDNMFLKGCCPNQVTYNTLIHGLCMKGKLDKAVSLLDRMVSSNCIPNDVTYGTIINGLVKLGRAEDAVKLMTAVQERGYGVNEYVYSALISGLFKGGKSEDARKLWTQMMEKGCKPNIVVYSALIDGLCREGKPNEAEEVLSEMIDKGCTPNAYTYSSLMKGFFKAGNSHKAVQLWKDMAEHECIHNKVYYSILIHGLCEVGNLSKAMMVWREMLEKGCKRDAVAYSSVIQGLCNAGSIEEALKLFHEMLCQETESQPDVVTYNILFNALCNQNSISHAIDLLNGMLDRACDPDIATCNIFLRTLREKLDPPQDGREFLDELVIRLLNRQRVFGASRIVQVMLQNFLPPKASTWERVVQELCKPQKGMVSFPFISVTILQIAEMWFTIRMLETLAKCPYQKDSGYPLGAPRATRYYLVHFIPAATEEEAPRSILVVAIAKTATAMVSKRVIMSFLTSEHKDALSNNGAKSKSGAHSGMIVVVRNHLCSIFTADDNMMQQCVGSLAQWFKCR
ncbi:Pentatricopeptide repeat-containing -like protein [Gossypium arboreum]|uniref:Pentatricopeptide repeat-containing-like protein n=1 Tax=Gossypium arboreum TaxID=29729 RepID=A0A0B0MVA6_GOSAR|nr:Pentatricopeptide repeat-containing -like protein [Gossypium arboreum]